MKVRYLSKIITVFCKSIKTPEYWHVNQQYFMLFMLQHCVWQLHYVIKLYKHLSLRAGPKDINSRLTCSMCYILQCNRSLLLIVNLERSLHCKQSSTRETSFYYFAIIVKQNLLFSVRACLETIFHTLL